MLLTVIGKKIRRRRIINTKFTFFSKSVIKYVNKHYPHVRIIIWYSNPVSVDTPIDFFDGLNCEIWSFDKKDVEEFSLNYNNQFIDTSKLKITSHEKNM